MLIANPIYDTVFKYLMEDLEIAKGMLALILGEEITELNIKPQESAYEGQVHGFPLTVYRLDFAAVLKKKDGSFNKVLIELQKTRRHTNIMRFRGYLAANYLKTDPVTNAKGVQKMKALEIVTIYFLGFDLKNISVPVLKVNKCLHDVVNNKSYHPKKGEPFVNLLTHESFFIQIPRLNLEEKTRLEKVLMIFSPIYATDDRRESDYTGNMDDALVKRIVKRLVRAKADEQLRIAMNIEEEIEEDLTEEIEELEEEIDEYKKTIKEKDKTIEEKDKTIEETAKALEEKDKTIKETAKALEEKDKALEDLLKQIEELKKNTPLPT